MRKRWLQDRRGTTAIEYALIASIMGIAALVGISALGGSTGGLWGNVGEAFNKHIKG